MSGGTPNNSDLVNLRIVSEEEYRENVKRAEEAQAQLDRFKAMNDAAKKAYDKQQELLRKIEEGKEAERQLQALASTSGSRMLSLAGPSGQANPPTTQRRDPAPNPYMQQIYGTSYQKPQTGTRPSGSSSSQQNVDVLSYYRAWQPQTIQSVHVQNHVQPQQSFPSRSSSTTSRSPVGQQGPVQQGRQALPMQPVVSTLQSNQVQAYHQSVPVSLNTSVQQQNHTTTQSGQGSAVPNFVTSFRAREYQAPSPSVSTYGALNASRMTEVSQPLLSTAAPLPKVPAKPDGAELCTTAAEVRAQLVNRTPSLSNPVPDLLLPEGSSQRNDPLVDITASWQRFSQSIVGWASSATPSSEMPLVNTKIKVVKDAKSQVFVTIPGMDGRNPIKITLQTLLASILSNSNKTSTPDHKITATQNQSAAPNQPVAHNKPAAPNQPVAHYKNALSNQTTAHNKPAPPIQPAAYYKPAPSNQPAAHNQPAAPDSWHGYRPHSVPQHQALQASASDEPLNMLTNNLGNMNSLARIAPSTHTESLAVSSSSERTPSQANKKSLAKDILRALSFSSLKRSRPDDLSALRALEPPAKRLASGNTPQASSAVDVILEASVENVERSPQIAGTYPPQAVNSDQATLTSAASELPVSNTKLSEPALPRSSNPQSTTAHNISQSHVSSIETTSTREVPQSSSSNNDDMCPVSANLIPNRPATPLFLPSLSSSPTPGPSDEIPTDSCNTIRHARRSTQSFYIIVPPEPFWVKQYNAQRSRKQGRWRGGESKRYSSSRGISSDNETSLGRHRGAEDDKMEDEDNDVIDLDPANNLASDGFEREAILLSCSRIREQPCKWNSCSVILNSAEKLIRHLAFAHQELFEEFSVCRWQHCGQPAVNWAKLFRHLKGHVVNPLRCAYQDCKELFRTPRQLVRHHRSVHTNDSLKPSDTPFVPTLKIPPPASPLVLPSYLMEPIQRPLMTKERHSSLGLWVLRQIAGPVNHEVKRYNAASKLLQSPSRFDQQDYQPYDFLSFPSTNYSSAPSLPSRIRGIEELPSEKVSKMIQDGLMLWGPAEEDEFEDELLLPSSPLLPISFDDKATVDEQLDINAVQIMLEN